MVDANIELIAIKRLLAGEEIVVCLRAGNPKIRLGQERERGERAGIQLGSGNLVAWEGCSDYQAARVEAASCRIENLASVTRKIAGAEGGRGNIDNRRGRRSATANSLVVDEKESFVMAIV